MADFTDPPDFAKMCREHLAVDECSLTQRVARWHLDDLRTFARTLERLISTEEERVSAAYSGPPQDYPGWWLRDVVVRQLRQSFVAACMDGVVFHIGHVCRDVATLTSCEAPDLGRDAIKRARKFLSDAGFERPAPGHWDHLLDIYRFRNTVVHAGAFVVDPNELRRFDRLLKNAPGIIARSGSFDIEIEFTEHVRAHVGDVLDALHEELVGLCRRVAT